MIIVLPRDSAEFAVTIAAIPVVLFLLAACGLAVAHEIKWWVFHVFIGRIDPDFVHRLMTASLVTMLAAMSYCTYLADISLGLPLIDYGYASCLQSVSTASVITDDHSD